jgi:hypothetical protein
VRDTIARRSDVDKSSMKYEVEPGKGRYRNGTITFVAKKGASINLEKILESLKATRLSKGTRSGVNFLDITAEGEVAVVAKEILLKVSGTGEQFRLGDDPKVKRKEGEQTPFQRLQQTLARGEKIARVTGRVQGWSGRWPEVLRELAGNDKAAARKPALLMVTDFQTVK